MVKAIRDVEKAIGNGVKTPTAEEEENKKVARRSIVARVDIPMGTIITKEILNVKRPGTRLEPKYMDLLVGKRAKEKIDAGQLMSLTKLV